VILPPSEESKAGCSRAAEGHRYFEAGAAAHRNRQLRACASQRVGTVRHAVRDE